MSASDRRALALACVLLSSAAFAEQRWGLTWKAADGCIQAAELAERVERRLGRPVFGAEPDLRIDGYLVSADGTPKNAKWRARLTLIDAHGTVEGSRDVTTADASCRGIDDSLVLVVAVMIDPSAALTPFASPSPPPPTPSPPPVATPGPTPPPAPPGQLIPQRPLPMPWEAAPPDKMLLVNGQVYLGYQQLDQGAFYQMVHRKDLEGALYTRSATRVLARVAGFIAATAGAGFLVAHWLDVDCVRFSGTPQNHGTCVQSADWALWTGVGLAAFGVGSLALGFALPAHPTTDGEDQQLIDEYNARSQEKVRQRAPIDVQLAPIPGGVAVLLSLQK
ncbi:MAG: hypothetical protein QM723_27830 [Myxococcaceae bacterium]